MSKSTKSVSLSQEFLRASAGNETDALAYMLMSAFGVSLTQCRAAVDLAIETNDVKVLVLMVTSGVQVRANVVFVGPEYGNVRSKYPLLIVSGNRTVADMFNFSALHVCGHLVSMISNSPLAKNVYSKAGNCVTGEYTTDTDAGKINKEIANSWPSLDVSDARTWSQTQPQLKKEFVESVFAGIPAQAKAFTAKLSGTPSVPGRPATAGGEPKGLS